MQTDTAAQISIKAVANAPMEKVWTYWTSPHHIARWNQASDDWWTPWAKNDLRPGGEFLSRMEAKDGSAGFDFAGRYDDVKQNELIAYTMGDGRKATVSFEDLSSSVAITTAFDPESTNSLEMQKGGWQAILDNFKRYVEEHQKFDLLHFDIVINAPVETVYTNMIGEGSYTEWTSAFNAGSRFEGSWDKGSKIHFIGSDDKGEEGGMVSRIKENIPNKLVQIEHLGILKGDEEITEGPDVQGWSGATEEYRFTSRNGSTQLDVYMDTTPEFKSYFEETWPKGLQQLKQICER